MSRTSSLLLAAATALGVAVSLKRRRDEPGRLVRRYYAAWERGDADVLATLLADEYHGHVHALPGTEERDRSELTSLFAAHSAAFEWTKFDVRDVLQDGSRLAARVAMRARHRETRSEGEIEGLAIFRIADGRIAEEWSSWDYLGLADQLGLAKVD